MPDSAPLVSFVTPTFNRASLVVDSVASALSWIDSAGGSGEVVIVDDASTDGTLATLAARFAAEIDIERVRLVTLQQNVGVTGAKNAGLQAARGKWLIFLDSDDVILADQARAMLHAIDEAGDAPVLFFRAQDFHTGEAIGTPVPQSFCASIDKLLNDWKLGDCLPVAQKAAMERYPYVAVLRGFEGIAWLRIMRDIGAIKVLPILALRVRRASSDRISARRAPNCHDAQGTWMMLREFGGHMTLSRRLRLAQFAIRGAFHCGLAGLRRSRS